ncbi:opine metallophore biosynthesis dehydrogenase [Cohnella xylanilytica]|uniref:opine metallophore biosynthesis dehydrogenase n=1 Tax=Cohnella xylanilytica TaxID=557555 RepID=UPI001BB307C2|nr:opine metallophore biosynthesis dehydrogenase [Cohnella xylanilytica]
MNDHPRILIAGTGPASIQMAVLLKNRWNCAAGIVGRPSARSESFFAALHPNGLRVRADVQNPQHRELEGECRLDHVFQEYEVVAGPWDTLILAVTADAYLEVLKRLSDDVLRGIRRVALLSPTFGSNSLIRQFMNDRSSEVEIISFSTYLGDTRWAQDRPSHRVVTTGVKKKVFIGSTQADSPFVEKLRTLYQSIGIVLEPMRSPFEAETRNISLYVHPPLFMNEFALDVLFGEASAKKYVYKLFPEGPITPELVRQMLASWKEISAILDKLRLRGVNLLKFMVDDNYPVRPESLPRRDIEEFPNLEAVRQEYLLYVRYASLLIDPFSEPDSNGRYYDFSTVPIRTIFVNREGRWDIPRMPKEDYYRIKIIQGIARHLRSDCPTIDRYLAIYERKLGDAALKLRGERLSDAFQVRSFEEDIERICESIDAGFHTTHE